MGKGYPICFYRIRSKINSELGLQVIVSTEVVSALNSYTVLRSTQFGTNRIKFYENKFYSSRFYTILPLLELVLQHLSCPSIPNPISSAYLLVKPPNLN